MASPSPTPERAIYGFVLYLLSIILVVLYLFWALLPEHLLHSFGLTYWPDKHWVISAPIFLVTFICIIPLFYVATSFANTIPLNNINTITDAAAHDSVDSDKLPNGAIPSISDLDLSAINKCLYLKDAIH